MDAPASLERIRSYVARYRERLAAPGLAVAITDRERCLGVIVDGLANVEARTPVDPTHRFQIGSISKGFTALAVLRQVEEGRVDLEAPVTVYLPWFEVRTAFPPITVHHLLSHTSGLVMGTDFTGDAASEAWSLRETETGFAPGERFLYSNVGYKTLGLVLEVVTGRPWWATVREHVMDPIGMGSAEVVITDRSRERLAVGYAGPFGDRPWFPRHGWAPSPWFVSGTADGTICATAEELTAYERLLLAGGEGVVSPASFARMTTPVGEDPGTGDRYGYGIRWSEAVGRRYLGHGGGMIGFTAGILVEPDAGFGAVSLMNSAFGRHRDLLRYALTCLAAESAGDAVPDVPDVPDPYRVGAPERFAGRYDDALGGIEVEAVGDRLFVNVDRRRVALLPTGAGSSTFGVDDADLDRFVLGFEPSDRRAHRATWGPRLLVRDGEPDVSAVSSPALWAALPGRYASWNPWASGFDVVLRGAELWLGPVPDGLEDLEPERRLTPLPDGTFRVGEAWSPDRVRFDAVVEGRATRAIFDAAPFYRTFTTEGSLEGPRT